MNISGHRITILVADSNLADREVVAQSFADNAFDNPLHFVEDGEQLLQYLKREGDFTHLEGEPLPGIILLDLKLPKIDGRVALAEISQDERLCRIPVIALANSAIEQDMLVAQGIDVNLCITKPVTIRSLLQHILSIQDCWFEFVAPEEDQQAEAA